MRVHHHDQKVSRVQIDMVSTLVGPTAEQGAFQKRNIRCSFGKQPKFLGREPRTLVNILTEISITDNYNYMYHNS